MFLLYGWTLLAFIWKLPSWLNYFTVGETLVILAYSLTSAFIESTFVTGVILLFAVVLPPRFLLSDFVLNGSILAMCVLGSAMIFLSRYARVSSSMVDAWPVWLAITAAVFIFLLFLAGRVNPIRQVILFLADRLRVLPYLLAPLSALSLVVILYRNLV